MFSKGPVKNMFKSIVHYITYKKLTVIMVFVALFNIYSFYSYIYGEQVDQKLLTRLKTEGCENIAILEKAFSKIHLSWLNIQDDRTIEYNYYSNDNNFLLKKRKKNNECYDFYFCKNNKYFFEIGKKETEKSWRIDVCQNIHSFNPYEFPAVSDLCSLFPFNVLSTSLPKLIMNPDFHITNIRYVGDPIEEKIGFDFVIQSDNIGEGDIKFLKTGSIILLPKKFWAISEMTLCFNRNGVKYINEFIFNYDDNIKNPFFQLKSSQIQLVLNEEDSKNIIWDNNVLEINETQLSDDELYLSHYGLPEPDFGESRSNRIRYIMMTLGGILILLAGWQMYHKSRDKREEIGL